MTEEKKTSPHTVLDILCEVYRSLCSEEGIDFPLHEEQVTKLDSIIKTVYARYFGYEPWPTKQDKAAAFFYYIIKDHSVTEGNKRLAVTWLEFYCSAHHLEITLREPFTLDSLAVSVERESGPHDVIIKLLKNILFS